MARWSFGLRQLFLWTAAIALGLVALRSATATWVAAFLGVAVAVLATAILLAAYRRGPQRAYWLGFATFGCTYMLLLVVSWTLARMAGNDSPLAAHNLPTQQLASGSYHWLYDEAFEKYRSSRGGSSPSYAGVGQTLYFGTMPGDPAIAALPGSSTPGDKMGPGMPGAPMSGSGPMAVALSFATPTSPSPGPNETDFVNVAHARWTLLFAAEIWACSESTRWTQFHTPTGVVFSISTVSRTRPCSRRRGQVASLGFVPSGYAEYSSRDRHELDLDLLVIQGSGAFKAGIGADEKPELAGRIRGNHHLMDMRPRE
jgi:hypothetical protein